MRRNYDIFEKLPDGSSQWRIRVPGKFEAKRTMQEMSEHSLNEFYAIDVATAAVAPVKLSQGKESARVPHHAE